MTKDIHTEAMKYGLFILHQIKNGKHYSIAARKHPESDCPEVISVTLACKTSAIAKRKALDMAIENLKNYNPDDVVSIND